MNVVMNLQVAPTLPPSRKEPEGGGGILLATQKGLCYQRLVKL